MTSMSKRIAVVAVLLVGGAVQAQNGAGQEPAPAEAQERPGFQKAYEKIRRELDASVRELAQLRERITDEKLPMADELAKLEQELADRRAEYDEVARTLADKTQALSNLTGRIEALRTQSGRVAALLGEFHNNFEARLHIAELQRHAEPLHEARLAMENDKLDERARFEQQLAVVDLALDQIEEQLGGERFSGRAVADGVLEDGTFVVVGPTAVFLSADSRSVGTVEERTGAPDPTVIPFKQKEDREAAAQLALGTGGSFPFDVTLGNAHKVESIDESWWEHVQKGGAIMLPIAVLAGAALLVVLWKWLSMMFVRRPSKKQFEKLLRCVQSGDRDAALAQAVGMPGPAGRMLQAGVEHLDQPRALIEEVMFEKMLATKLKLQSWLPFVAICATSAPLLGLLGTVTGIMGTFALMTEFGTGDPKVLSSGISEALITTEHGLIVAIPSLLLHAFLSRKAKGIVDGMEKMGLQFVNRVPVAVPVRPGAVAERSAV